MTEDFVIENGVLSIGDYAFRGCTGITSVTIHDSVISIENCVFIRHMSITIINISENNMNFCLRDGILYNKNITEIIKYPEGRKKLFSFLDCVVSIADDAFSRCESLISIKISDSVTSIGENAFSYCYRLKKPQFSHNSKVN